MAVLMLMRAVLVWRTGALRKCSVFSCTHAGQFPHKRHQIPQLALRVRGAESGHPGGDNAVLQDQ